jgi:hypothetical protein
MDEVLEEVRQLREELRELRDRQEIHDCVLRYARGLDRHDEEVLASVFHDDALDHHGDFIGTRDEFVPWANALHEEGWAAHTHFMANHRVEIEGDVAHSETYVLFVLRRKDDSRIDLGGGRYIDRLERRNGEWRIGARELVVDWRAEADPSAYGRARTYPTGTWDRDDPSYRRPFELELPTASQA